MFPANATFHPKPLSHAPPRLSTIVHTLFRVMFTAVHTLALESSPLHGNFGINNRLLSFRRAWHMRCDRKLVTSSRRAATRTISTLISHEITEQMKPKLLIVDDDVAITQQLFWMLCEEFDVTTANDLASAIRRATIYEPDVTILDLHLPPTLNSSDTGIRILEYIKNHLPSSKVFVVSSASHIEMQKECFRIGADGFLSKPLEVEQLLSSVRCAGIEQQQLTAA